MLVSGLTLDKSSKDIVDGKVVGVSEDLYMKGCVQDVSAGIKVRFDLFTNIKMINPFIFKCDQADIQCMRRIVLVHSCINSNNNFEICTSLEQQYDKTGIYMYSIYLEIN